MLQPRCPTPFPPDFSAMSRDLSSAFNLDFVTETGQSGGGRARTRPGPQPLAPAPTLT